MATGLLDYFHSGQPGALTFEHVAASGSLPPSFPMTPIGEARYWDGGLFSNTPLGPAINAGVAGRGSRRRGRSRNSMVRALVHVRHLSREPGRP